MTVFPYTTLVVILCGLAQTIAWIYFYVKVFRGNFLIFVESEMFLMCLKSALSGKISNKL